MYNIPNWKFGMLHIGTTVLLIGVPVNKVRVTKVMLNQNPMSSSEDNESKYYPELDESALLVAQAKLSRVFEIRPLDTCQFLSDPGSFRTYQVGLPCGYK